MKTYKDYSEEYDNIVAASSAEYAVQKCAYVTFHFLQDNGITSEPWQDSFAAELEQALSRFSEADQMEFVAALKATIDLT